LKDSQADIYDPQYVKGVFDRCGSAYRRWSSVASFGFTWLWRRQCVNNLPAPRSGAEGGYDLMAGTGELWPHLASKFPAPLTITAIDISSTMVEQAIARWHKNGNYDVKIIEADILASDLAANSAHYVVSAFGLKTFNKDQQAAIANTIAHVLKPGGTFSLVEASDPIKWFLRPAYRFHMEKVLPFIERKFLNGAQDFSMIGTYTKNFVDCRHFEQCLRAAGLEVQYKSYFFGCASGVIGMKPMQA
jgi:ubiquinone/menaquinone biosynthesis C-methylase UbiE